MPKGLMLLNNKNANMKTRIIVFSVLFMSSMVLNAQTIMNIHQSNGTVMEIPVNTIDSIDYTVFVPNLATLTTLPITNLTGSTATSGGNIINDGGSAITQRGIVWSTSPNPTTADNFTIDGSGTGSFSSNLTGLVVSTTYYLRAYATNNAGTAYGNELSFYNIISNPGLGVTFDGYTYPSIVLGNGQEWMAENLRTVVYANGDSIPNVIYPYEWWSLSTGAWAHYNNDSQFENPYGKLYNWFTVVDPRNVCPIGWHVPSNAEWSAFIQYLDPQAGGGTSFPNIAGGKMKSTGTQYWVSPNSEATNEIGFSGLPGGYRRFDDGTFEKIGEEACWWSTEQTSFYDARYYLLFDNNASVYRTSYGRVSVYSVRCLKD
jgi:uncharacterized protein (TIGR02145 family)